MDITGHHEGHHHDHVHDSSVSSVTIVSEGTLDLDEVINICKQVLFFLLRMLSLCGVHRLQTQKITLAENCRDIGLVLFLWSLSCPLLSLCIIWSQHVKLWRCYHLKILRTATYIPFLILNSWMNHHKAVIISSGITCSFHGNWNLFRPKFGGQD